MITQTMFFQNLICFLVAVLLLLVTSRGAGDTATTKLIGRCRDNERRALLDFKADAIDDYGILSSWDKSKEEDCCKWRGIRCSNRTGHVTGLHIPAHYDYNPLPYNWTGLRGGVSPSLIELNQLTYLNLSYNHFGGKFPQQLGNLTNLQALDLRYNYYITVESLEWLSHLRSLRHLDMSAIDLRKSTNWLQQIYKLSSLTQLLLYSCHLPDSPLLPFNHTSSSLTSLAVVDLSYNNFISPSSYNWLFNFSSSLVHIDLSMNFLRGSIPEAFGTMVSLENLFLVYCQLEGMLPDSFRNLSRLDTLDISYNNFNGTLSEFLHPLAANEHNSFGVLRSGFNQFGGSLPDFTKFPSLREIMIPQNKLTGSFPENFGQVSGLVRIHLSLNQITGSFPNLTLFSSLKELILHSNKLEDKIPEAYLSNLSKLEYLDLSMNLLSLKFSLDWVPPFQLDVILLHNCTLGPYFPNWIRSQYKVSVLDISNTRISDTVPLWFWDLSPRLEYLNMSNNQIEGMLPDLSSNFADFVWIDLSSNRLKGLIPSLPLNVKLMHLPRNMFTGPVSSICTPAHKFLISLDLSGNQLSGELPDCWMNDVDQLIFLNLASNNLSGKIPTSIGFLSRLKILQLRNNSFIGELPSSLKNAGDLKLLDLSENKLSGEVPTWIGTDLTSLIVFSLRKNEFFGRMPPHICHLRDAHILDLSHNNFSGNIPNCINNLTSLIDIEDDSASIYSVMGRRSGTYSNYNEIYVANALVQWKGQESVYRNTLGLLKLIDLSSNRLVGIIPEEFASLEGLISLNLSRNKLTGNIIEKIGQMKHLEILDLSRNQLSGEIPISLASLTFLNVLDLSRNNLTGRIPSSTQLQSFDKSVYAGNDKLCGLPLSSKCPGQETDVLPSPPGGHDKEENNEEDDKFTKIGLYASVVLGFATGFWGLLGPIMLQSTWRRAYFRLLGKIADWIYVTTTINMHG